MVEIAHTSRDYAELSGRTQPVIGDVVVSLINLGISLQGITTYAKRENRPTIPAPQQIGTQKPLSLLQAGTKLSHPSHIPHHLPPLPDPHAYIRTPVSVSSAPFLFDTESDRNGRFYRHTSNQWPSTRRSVRKLPTKNETLKRHWHDFWPKPAKHNVYSHRKTIRCFHVSPSTPSDSTVRPLLQMNNEIVYYCVFFVQWLLASHRFHHIWPH